MALVDRRGHTTLPVEDAATARGFWEGMLGFRPVQVPSTAVLHGAGHGSVFAISSRGGKPPGEHAQIGFTTLEIHADVAGLRQRGVEFIEYDRPKLKTVDGIAQLGPNTAAWFNDPQGNLIGLVALAE